MKTLEIRVFDRIKLKDIIIRTKISKSGVFVQILEHLEQVLVKKDMFEGIVCFSRPPNF